MKIKENSPAAKRLEQLIRQDEINREESSLLSDFLDHHFDEIDSQLLSTIHKALSLPIEKSYSQAILSTLDIDPDEEELKKLLECGFLSDVRLLSAKDFLGNPYLKKIRLKEKRSGKWSLSWNYFLPYEGFLLKATESKGKEKDYALKDAIAFFPEKVDYPVVLEKDHVWMSVTPYEIETMKEPLKKATGKVLALGLGLGYYPFMALEKKEVEEVVVVEKDRDILSLFEKEILPQFPRKKITLIHADAKDYLEKKNTTFDTTFFDIHSTAEDSLESYLLALKERKRTGNVSFWIESSTLSFLRQLVLLLLEMELEKDSTVPEGTKEEQNLFLCMRKNLQDRVLTSAEEVDLLLSDSLLQELLLNCENG